MPWIFWLSLLILLSQSKVVSKAEKRIKPTTSQLSILQRQLRGEPVTKIAVPGQNGITFIDLNEIVFSEASNNYSKLMLTDGRHFLVSKALKDVQEVLKEEHFFMYTGST